MSHDLEAEWLRLGRLLRARDPARFRRVRGLLWASTNEGDEQLARVIVDHALRVRPEGDA